MTIENHNHEWSLPIGKNSVDDALQSDDRMIILQEEEYFGGKAFVLGTAVGFCKTQECDAARVEGMSGYLIVDLGELARGTHFLPRDSQVYELFSGTPLSGEELLQRQQMFRERWNL